MYSVAYVIAVLPQINTNSKEAKEQPWSSSVTKQRNVDHMTPELKKPLGWEPGSSGFHKQIELPWAWLGWVRTFTLRHITYQLTSQSVSLRKHERKALHEQKPFQARSTQSGHDTQFSLNKLFFWSNKFRHLLKTPGGSVAWQPDWIQCGK